MSDYRHFEATSLSTSQRIQHERDIANARTESDRRYANQIAELKAVETQRDILVTTLHMILAKDVGRDRRGKGAKQQVQAVRELLGRLGFWS